MPPKVVLKTLDKLWAALEPMGLPMAIMGGLALAVWKYVRATHAVDLLVGINQSQTGALIRRLNAAGFRCTRTPPVMSLGSIEILQLEYEPEDALMAVQVDLLLVDTAYHRQALQRRVAVDLPDFGSSYSVLSCEDLIVHKLLAGRIIDRADAASLVRANCPELDVDYLLTSARQLKLENELLEIWDEAFPGQTPSS